MTWSRVIQRSGHGKRLAVVMGGDVEDIIKPFQQFVARRVLLHQVAAGGDVNPVVGSVQYPTRHCVGRGTCGRCPRLRLVNMDMNMYRWSGCCRGESRYEGCRSIRRGWLLLQCTLACFPVNVAGETFEQERHYRHGRARCGNCQPCGGLEQEKHDAHL